MNVPFRDGSREERVVPPFVGGGINPCRRPFAVPPKARAFHPADDDQAVLGGGHLLGY